MLQPIKAAFEAAKYSLSNLQEEDVSENHNKLIQPSVLSARSYIRHYTSK